MLTHRIKLPDGTEIEFFAETDQETFAEIQKELDDLKLPTFAEFIAQERKKHKAKQAVKKARKNAKLARAKNRSKK
ncbi:hypothetical protein [Mannheimia haemolytica]|uniref:hypothetical protein n=1 Tax=Mannheimia haemolytica TaxID=75985 RepID=UPI001ADAE3DB|nr:hypothetical protein [Mannheimia haemolytica]